MIEDLLEAWRANNAITLELLDLCPDETFELKPGKGKTIRSNFVHLVGVRRMWMEERTAAAAKIVPKLDWKAATRSEIRDALNQTHDLMGDVFRKMADSTKPNRFSLLKFFAYVIAHEAHHRSQIEIALRIGGHELEDAASYGLWDWSKK
ncbi:MAG: DinB family protein [Fimbriimonadales bacterium]